MADELFYEFKDIEPVTLQDDMYSKLSVEERQRAWESGLRPVNEAWQIVYPDEAKRKYEFITNGTVSETRWSANKAPKNLWTDKEKKRELDARTFNYGGRSEPFPSDRKDHNPATRLMNTIQYFRDNPEKVGKGDLMDIGMGVVNRLPLTFGAGDITTAIIEGKRIDRIYEGNPKKGDIYGLARDIVYAEMQEDDPTAMKVMRGVSELPAYAIDIALTGGIGAVTKGIGRKGLAILAKKLGKEKFKKFMASAAVKGAVKAAPAVTEAGIYAGVTDVGGTLAQALPQRDIKYDETTETGFAATEKDSWMNSLPKAVINQMSEYLVEKVSGEALAKGVSKIGAPIRKAMTPKPTSADVPENMKTYILNRIRQTWQRANPDVGPMASQIGFNGMIAELGEERVTEIVQGANEAFFSQMPGYNRDAGPQIDQRFGMTGDIAQEYGYQRGLTDETPEQVSQRRDDMFTQGLTEVVGIGAMKGMAGMRSTSTPDMKEFESGIMAQAILPMDKDANYQAGVQKLIAEGQTSRKAFSQVQVPGTDKTLYDMMPNGKARQEFLKTANDYIDTQNRMEARMLEQQQQPPVQQDQLEQRPVEQGQSKQPPVEQDDVSEPPVEQQVPDPPEVTEAKAIVRDLTRADLMRMSPGMRVNETPQGYEVEMGNGKRVLVPLEDGLSQYTSDADLRAIYPTYSQYDWFKKKFPTVNDYVRKERKRLDAGGGFGGFITGPDQRMREDVATLDVVGIVRINNSEYARKNMNQTKTYMHEMMHLAYNGGMFTSAEMDALIKKYSDPNRTVMQHSEDFAQTAKFWEEPGMIQRFVDWINRMASKLTGGRIELNGEAVRRLIYSENFWKRDVQSIHDFQVREGERQQAQLQANQIQQPEISQPEYNYGIKLGVQRPPHADASLKMMNEQELDSHRTDVYRDINKLEKQYDDYFDRNEQAPKQFLEELGAKQDEYDAVYTELWRRELEELDATVMAERIGFEEYPTEIKRDVAKQMMAAEIQRRGSDFGGKLESSLKEFAADWGRNRGGLSSDFMESLGYKVKDVLDAGESDTPLLAMADDLDFRGKEPKPGPADRLPGGRAIPAKVKEARMTWRKADEQQMGFNLSRQEVYNEVNRRRFGTPQQKAKVDDAAIARWNDPNNTFDVYDHEHIIRLSNELALSKDPNDYAKAIDLMILKRDKIADVARNLGYGKDPLGKTESSRRKDAVTDAIFLNDKKALERIRNRKSSDPRKQKAGEKAWEREQARLQKVREYVEKLGYDWSEKGFTKLGTNVTDSIKVARYAINTKKNLGRRANDIFTEITYGFMLSGHQTQMVNFLSNTTWGATMMAEQYASAALNSALGNTDDITLADYKFARKQLKSMTPSKLRVMDVARKNAMTRWLTERSVIEEQVGIDEKTKYEVAPALPGKGGQAFRAIFGFGPMSAIDQFYKTLFTNLEVGVHAAHLARTEAEAFNRKKKDASKHMTEQEIADRAEELLLDKRSPAWVSALNQAEQKMFQDDGGIISQKVIGVSENIRSIPLVGPAFQHLVAPFVRTPTRIIGNALVRMPVIGVPVYHKMYQNYKDGNHVLKGVSREALSQISVGLLVSLLWNLVDADEEETTFTGAKGALGEKSRTFRYQEGVAPPQAVRIAGNWYQYDRFDPFAMALATVVDAIQALKSDKGVGEKGADVVRSIGGSVQEKTFFRSVGDLIKAVDSEDGGQRWVASALTRFVPNLYTQAARASSPTITDSRADTAFESFKKRAKIAPAEDIHDPWGRKAKTSGGITGVKSKTDKAFVGDRVFVNWNRLHPKTDEQRFPTRPRREYTYNGVKQKMSEEQYSQYAELAGTLAKNVVEKMISDDMARNPDDVTMKVVEGAISRARIMLKDHLHSKGNMDIPMESFERNLQSKLYSSAIAPLRAKYPRRGASQSVHEQEVAEWQSDRDAALRYAEWYRQRPDRVRIRQ